MKRVYICSRFHADENHTKEENIHKAFFACTVALEKGYAPFAPHLIYPNCLDDDDPQERSVGLAAGNAWLATCDELWQWGATISEGMAAEIRLAQELNIPVRIYNSIGIPKEKWNGVKLADDTAKELAMSRTRDIRATFYPNTNKKGGNV